MIKFNKVAIIGVGLIGSSLALALRKYGLASEVRGSGRKEIGRASCREGV